MIPQVLSTIRHLPNLLDSYSSSVFLFADDGSIAGLGANSTDAIQAFYEMGSGKQLAATVGQAFDDGARAKPDSQLLFTRQIPLAFINPEKRQVLFLNAAAFSAPQGRTKAFPIPSQWYFRPLDGGADAQAPLKSADPVLRNGGTASRVFRWKDDRYAFVAETTVPKPRQNPGKRVNQLTLVDAQTGEVIFNLADEIVAPTFDRSHAFGEGVSLSRQTAPELSFRWIRETCSSGTWKLASSWTACSGMVKQPESHFLILEIPDGTSVPLPYPRIANNKDVSNWNSST